MPTDTARRNATCPQGKGRHRSADAGGLYLEVSPGSSRRWFVKYRFGCEEKRLARGIYAAVSLKEARAARDDARNTLAAGIDPVRRRKADKLARFTSAATTFEAVALELHGTKTAEWSANHAAQWLRCLEKDLFPWLGSLPLIDVSAPLLLNALRRVERRGALRMAHDLREYAGQVFRHGIATGRGESNPAVDLHGALRPAPVKHLAALLEPKQVGDLLRAIDAHAGQPITRAALAL